MYANAFFSVFLDMFTYSMFNLQSCSRQIKEISNLNKNMDDIQIMQDLRGINYIHYIKSILPRNKLTITFFETTYIN